MLGFSAIKTPTKGRKGGGGKISTFGISAFFIKVPKLNLMEAARLGRAAASPGQPGDHVERMSLSASEKVDD